MGKVTAIAYLRGTILERFPPGPERQRVARVADRILPCEESLHTSQSRKRMAFTGHA